MNPPESRSPTILVTSGPGLLGATAEERGVLVAGFRRLVDGMSAPFQVCWRRHRVPASPIGLLAGDWQPNPDLGAMRLADLAAHALGVENSGGLRLETTITVSAADLTHTGDALAGAGLRWAARDLPGAEELAGVEQPGYLEVADGFARIWELIRWPGVALRPGWLAQLMPSRLQAALSYHVQPVPTAAAIEYLTRQLASMRASRLHDPSLTSTDPALGAALPNAERLRDDLSSGRERAFRVSLLLGIQVPNRESLTPLDGVVEAAAGAALCRLEPCRWRMASAHQALLPGGGRPWGRTAWFDSSSVATLVPWLVADLDQPSGILLGRNRDTGWPVRVDLFDDSLLPNANTGIYGHSGAGKTYLMSTLLASSVAAGVQAFVLDPENEYGALAASLGGCAYRLGIDSDLSLNVLEGPAPGEEPGAAAPIATEEGIADTVELAGIICQGLSEAEKAECETAVRTAYQATSAPVLADVAQLMPAGSRAGEVMRRWSRGGLGAMFSRPTNVDLDLPVVAFGMRELRDEMVGAVHYMLARALWHRIRARRRRTLLVIDELGLLFEDPVMRGFVVNLARRIRKYEGALVFATQNPGDLLSSEAGKVVATNPAINLFGGLRASEAQRLEQAFNLGADQRRALETAGRGEFLLAAGQLRVRLEVVRPAWQARLAAEPVAPE